MDVTKETENPKRPAGGGIPQLQGRVTKEEFAELVEDYFADEMEKARRQVVDGEREILRNEGAKALAKILNGVDDHDYVRWALDQIANLQLYQRVVLMGSDGVQQQVYPLPPREPNTNGGA